VEAFERMDHEDEVYKMQLHETKRTGAGAHLVTRVPGDGYTQGV
jgi:hypothetical protein